ncbi:hypothetical protein [Nocardioides sp. Leaf307]|uniref:hypothetical protein n=1 Tax=Nocardioides sp. Leaf307 TaxID=1736331 RepID=UPI0007035057|nr:hypothetical protein [Nocardioides sp. Leaf307]KQQ43703.1 hypothetical protein ASF50_07330 [Nocardioides sp. Leaf307]
MTVLDRIYREPAALLAFAAAVLAVLTWQEVLDEKGAAIALGVLTAAIGALRYFVTPAAEVVMQETPDGVLRAGPAAAVTATGTVLADVALQPLDDPGHRR